MILGQRVVFIKDLGPWDKYPTVTNAAELVVEDLWKNETIAPGFRLVYEDSLGELGELLFDNKGQFKGFQPVPVFYRNFYIG